MARPGKEKEKNPKAVEGKKWKIKCRKLCNESKKGKYEAKKEQNKRNECVVVVSEASDVMR